MQRTSPAKSVVAQKSKPPADRAVKLLTEDDAVAIMWLHYRDNRSQLNGDIKEYRAGILAKLMEGVAVEQVFAPYVKPAEPAKPVRRAA